MRKDRSLFRKITIGFALSALVYAAAAVILWNSPAIWEYFLYESLPYYRNTAGERLYYALPWDLSE